MCVETRLYAASRYKISLAGKNSSQRMCVCMDNVHYIGYMSVTVTVSVIQ